MNNAADRGLTRLNMRLPTLLLAILLVYLGSAFVHLNPAPSELAGLPHLKWSYLALAPPRALSGDTPHYLVSINSLIEDFDLDLANNYRQAERGDWDAGARFRDQELDHHAEVDRLGRERGTHSPFFSLLLAAFCWPLAGGPWVEAWAIFLTSAVTVLGLSLFCHKMADSNQQLRTVILALASPLWFYARDLWTEPWIMTLWILLLVSKRPLVLFFGALLGTTLKYPFVVVPLCLGTLELIAAIRSRGSDRGPKIRRGVALSAGSLLGLALVVVVVQWLFWESDHFSLFHSGIHGNFGFPGWALLGLWLDPENGLFFFFPLLLFGVGRLGNWKPTEWVPLLAFFLVHAAYQDWYGGAGFSARYLVPLLPILVAWIPLDGPRTLFRIALAWSLFWGVTGGMLPALVYDRTPWGVGAFVVSKFWKP